MLQSVSAHLMTEHGSDSRKPSANDILTLTPRRKKSYYDVNSTASTVSKHKLSILTSNFLNIIINLKDIKCFKGINHFLKDCYKLKL